MINSILQSTELQGVVIGVLIALGTLLITIIGLVIAWFKLREKRMEDRHEFEKNRAADKTDFDKKLGALKLDQEANRQAAEKFTIETAQRSTHEVDELKATLAKMKADLADAQKELADAQKQLADAREERAHNKGLFEGQLKILSDQNASFVVHLSERDKAIADLQSQVNALTQTVNDKDAALTEANTKLAGRNSENAALRMEVTRLEMEVSKLKTRVSELESRNKIDTGPLPALNIASAPAEPGGGL